jgi:hypothetical protein
MAEAARNVANLALLRDVTKAVVFYRKALAGDPEHAETARLLGHALILLGELKEAQTALSESFRGSWGTEGLPCEPGHPRGFGGWGSCFESVSK